MNIKTAIGDAYASQGKKLKQEGKLDKAIVCYRRAIQLDKNQCQYYESLAELYAQINRDQQAIDCYRQAIALQPDNDRAYACLGEIFRQQGNLEEASECYRQAIELAPNNAWFYYCLGKLLANRNNLEEAIACQQMAITLDPQQLSSHLELGNMFRQEGKFAEAIYYYQKAIAVNPRDEEAYIFLQYIHIESKQLDDLISFYQKLLGFAPDFPLIWGNLGDTLTQKGQLDRAISCYQTCCYCNAIASNPSLANLDWKLRKEKEPDFIIIGVAKCGTSSLFKYLSEHPQILPPHKKELNFFTPENFDKGIDWYLSQFPAIADTKDFLTGEASPAYFNDSIAIENISKLCLETKIILLLRNPVDRAISWYYHNVKCGYETRDINQVLQTEIQQLKNLSEEELQERTGHIFDGIYVNKIQKWSAAIPSENLLILQTEELANNTAKTVRQVFRFLGLHEYQSSQYLRYNTGNYNSVDPHLIEQLAEIFLPYNQQLEQYLNRKFNW
jgi:tetratricopeptide (TPR) repeat protein